MHIQVAVHLTDIKNHLINLIDVQSHHYFLAIKIFPNKMYFSIKINEKNLHCD